MFLGTWCWAGGGCRKMGAKGLAFLCCRTGPGENCQGSWDVTERGALSGLASGHSCLRSLGSVGASDHGGGCLWPPHPGSLQTPWRQPHGKARGSGGLAGLPRGAPRPWGAGDNQELGPRQRLLPSFPTLPSPCPPCLLPSTRLCPRPAPQPCPTSGGPAPPCGPGSNS